MPKWGLLTLSWHATALPVAQDFNRTSGGTEGHTRCFFPNQPNPPLMWHYPASTESVQPPAPPLIWLIFVARGCLKPRACTNSECTLVGRWGINEDPQDQFKSRWSLLKHQNFATCLTKSPAFPLPHSPTSHSYVGKELAGVKVTLSLVLSIRFQRPAIYEPQELEAASGSSCVIDTNLP